MRGSGINPDLARQRAAPPGRGTATTNTKALAKKRFATVTAWRRWLDTHHAGSRGLWLEFAKKENARPSVTHAEALETALCFGWIDGQTRSSAAGWWCQRFTPRGPRSKWSQVNCAAVERLRAEGKLRAAGLAQMEAAKSDGRWSAAYAPQRTITVPDDLKAALAAASSRARRFFASLDSKNRYAILYRLHEAKKPETRARRLLKFVRMLEAGEKLHQYPRAKRGSTGNR
jgi:uncharacterized protein YdeI (YjbR/CyaY-like superfamily)